MPFVFRPTSLRGEEYCCERPDGVGKAPLLDAAVRNGVGSCTFSVAVWRLLGLVAGLWNRRELCENTGMVCNNVESRCVTEKRVKILY